MPHYLSLLRSFLTPALVAQGQALGLTFAYALSLPVIWLLLCLWLNRKHPRRVGFLTVAFFLGALAVMPALPVEQYIATLSSNNTVLTVLWAASEEVLKFVAFMFVAYRASRFNGPRDYALAAVTAGLGFAGFENALYILHPVLNHDLAVAALSGGMRFLGADLLHGMTTSIPGIALGFAYFKPGWKKAIYAFFGLVVAAGIHGLFNLAVGNASQDQTLHIFAALWILAALVGLLWLRLRAMERPKFIQSVWDASVSAAELAYQAFVAKNNIDLNSTVPVRDILKDHGAVMIGGAYADLESTIAFLRTNYAVHLRSQGMGAADAAVSAKALVSDSISPQTMGAVFGILKEKQGVDLGRPQIEVFGKQTD